MKIPSLDFHKGKLSVKLAESAYDKEKNRKDKTTQHSSNIITSGGLSLDSGKNITIAGSNIDAGGDISLSAKENINIIPVKETQKTISEKTDREITLSLEIGNAYLDAAYAVSDAARAAAAVEDARQELSGIKKLRDIGKATDEAVKDAEINLEMALLNLGFNGLRAANTTADIAGASSTSFGTGFYADMRLDTIETESESKENRITHIPSEITSQKNITFLTNKDMFQTGSYIKSEKSDIIYNILENLEIISGTDKYDYTFDQETKQAGIVLGSANPASIAIDNIAGSIGYSTADQKTHSITHNNSKVTAEKGDIKINVKKDATISGADILAKNIDISIGEDLTVASKQNELHSKGGSKEFNIGYGSDGADFGAGRSKNRIDKVWTDRQTGIIGTNSIRIDTKGETRLTGSIIANIKNRIDYGNLELKTGKLTYQNLKNHENSFENGFNIQISGLGIEEKTKNNETKKYLEGTAELGIKNTGYEKESISYAVIGKGTIDIRDNTNIENLERNINKRETITKDIITGALDFDAGIDLRLSSKIGREEIKEELKTAPDNIIDNTFILSGGYKDMALTIAGTPFEFSEEVIKSIVKKENIKNNITAQSESNIEQIKESFSLRHYFARRADFLDSLAFLGQEIPILGNFIPTASRGNTDGKIIIIDTGGIYNNEKSAEEGFITIEDMMDIGGVSYPVIHNPYTEGTITEAALALFAGYKVPGLQWADWIISNPDIKEGDTIISNSHSGGAIKSSIGSNYIITNNNGIKRLFANQAPALGYFNNIDGITKNYSLGDPISTLGRLLSPFYGSPGKDEIPPPSYDRHKRVNNKLIKNIEYIKELE